MHSENALIIFVRNPVLGRVKTRLAASLGVEKTLAVYKFLLAHTQAIAAKTWADKHIFYADTINDNDLWNGFKKIEQEGETLGHRMWNAFEKTEKAGYKKIIIIGSDCFDLSAEITAEAFEKLNQNKIVIGPATDGGYYLLGMQVPVKNIFEQIAWSTGNVFSETIKRIKEQNLSYLALPMLNDVDEEKDITFKFQ